MNPTHVNAADENSNEECPDLLVLTPWKDAAAWMDRYFELLARLTYPCSRISLGFLEGDSRDDTYRLLEEKCASLASSYRRVGLWKRDYGFSIPLQFARSSNQFQLPRRATLARSRNYLLSMALADETWVMWLDSDVSNYPEDIVERLLAFDKPILHPHCVMGDYGGPTFDRNAWRDKGKVHMDQLRGGPDLVRLDTVGGTMLMVLADLHREGLIFPPFPYGPNHRAARDENIFLPEGQTGEVETEGFGLMAQDMGYQCWGLPNLEIVHPAN